MEGDTVTVPTAPTSPQPPCPLEGSAVVGSWEGWRFASPEDFPGVDGTAGLHCLSGHGCQCHAVTDKQRSLSDLARVGRGLVVFRFLLVGLECWGLCVLQTSPATRAQLGVF